MGENLDPAAHRWRYRIDPCIFVYLTGPEACVRTTFTTRWLTLAAVAGWLMFPSGIQAQEATKPLLSEEIGKVIDKDGVEAGQRRFDELYPAQKDKYQIDIQGFLELTSTYMQSGNAAAGQQVAQMMMIVMQDSMATSMGMAVPNRNPQPQAKPPPEPHPLGTARDDLDRFMGLYGDPHRADEHRTLWVGKSCDGYLVAGASWGDASPWWMRSMSDTVFETTVFGGEKLRFEFLAQPQSIVHELDYMPNPLPRVGPLPDDWQECIQPLETGR